MIVKLLAEHHLEFLSLKGGCRGLSESTLVKMPHCWNSHATAKFLYVCCSCVFFIPFTVVYMFIHKFETLQIGGNKEYLYVLVSPYKAKVHFTSFSRQLYL